MSAVNLRLHQKFAKRATVVVAPILGVNLKAGVGNCIANGKTGFGEKFILWIFPIGGCLRFTRIGPEHIEPCFHRGRGSWPRTDHHTVVSKFESICKPGHPNYMQSINIPIGVYCIHEIFRILQMSPKDPSKEMTSYRRYWYSGTDMSMPKWWCMIPKKQGLFVRRPCPHGSF